MRGKSGDRKGHRHAVIPLRINMTMGGDGRRPTGPWAAPHHEAVGALVGVEAQRAQPRDQHRNPVALFYAQLRRPGDGHFPASSGQRRDGRQLVDQPWHVGGLDGHHAASIAFDDDRTARLAGVDADLFHANVGAEAPQHVDERRPRRIQAHVVDFDARSGKQGRSNHPIRRGREVAWNRKAARRQVLQTGNRGGASPTLDADAECRECPLRVIARLDRLSYGRDAVREQTGEQDGALHLCARHV